MNSTIITACVSAGVTFWATASLAWFAGFVCGMKKSDKAAIITERELNRKLEEVTENAAKQATEVVRLKKELDKVYSRKWGPVVNPVGVNDVRGFTWHN